MGRWRKDAAHTKFEDRQSYVQIVGKKKEKTTCLLGQILCLYRSTAHAATPIHMLICLFVSPCIELFHPQISHERIWIYIIYSFIFFIDFFHAHFYGGFGVGAQEASSVVMDEVKKKSNWTCIAERRKYVTGSLFPYMKSPIYGPRSSTII